MKSGSKSQASTTSSRGNSSQGTKEKVSTTSSQPSQSDKTSKVSDPKSK